MHNVVPEKAGLTVRLRQRTPISLDVELFVGAGEILALVGPSGSGKTTTLRAVAGLYRPAEGKISCNGSVWFDSEAGIWIAARKRRVGMVLQSYALFPHLSAIENVMESLAVLPAQARRAEASSLLSRMHLGVLEQYRRPAQLSGGQQQRVAVARALARRPDVLLLDEPFSAVDRVTRRNLRRELVELRRDLPMPTILVTHDLDDVARLADRICVMNHGTILQQGPVAEVMQRPANAAVVEILDLAPDEGPERLIRASQP